MRNCKSLSSSSVLSFSSKEPEETTTKHWEGEGHWIHSFGVVAVSGGR